jgi:hypothetical protein
MSPATQKKSTGLLSSSLLTDDQQGAIDRLYEHDATLLVAAMGSGKTTIALTALSELFNAGELQRVLIVAPLKVCNKVWRDEHSKWDHLQHLDVGVATGAEATRKAIVEAGHQITVINFENLKWLFKQYGKQNLFDGLVIDELSKLKTSGGVAFKALRGQRKKFKWAVGMTGTPVSEDWQGLYGQMLIVDGGEALGTRKEQFLNRYFYPTDYNQYNWALRDGAVEAITARINGVVYSVGDYRDQLPAIEYVTVNTAMPDTTADAYRSMCNSFVFNDIEAGNEAVKTGKLQQLAAGFIYDGDGETITLDHCKYDALAGWVGLAPVIIVYTYQAQLDELLRRYPDAATIHEPNAVDDWNEGRLNILLMHPKSGGHGLNLARGGCLMVWLSPNWSRDLWEQTNARLWRRGQTNTVRVVSLITAGTIEELVVQRVEDKAEFQRLFDEHIKKASG